ncbi:MAG: Flp pilus assembly complex ATPase component TadA, partial [Candidatus Yanofskybacteria bacterium]|nr:Flp pilus assembly complex ATPase component TadA [Candidatus Yanofskybacteria bacterium]
MSTKIPTTLVEELIKLGILSRKDATIYEDSARKEDKEFGQILVEKDIVPENDLLDIKSRLYHLPILRVEEIQLNSEALQELTEEVVSFYKVAPFAKEGNVLRVGMINPEDIDALEALKFIASDRNLKIEKYVMGHKDFESILRNYRSLTAEVGKALESLSEEIGEEKITQKKIEEVTAEGAVTRIVASVVKYAVESRASDIHIEPFEEKVNVRFRIDGVLVVALTLPKNVHSAVLTRIKVLSNLKIDETRLAQDGRFSTTLNKRRIDFRVSTFPTKSGEKVVMRILDPLTNRIDLPGLGIEGRSNEVLRRAMSKPFGCILITGPTGSGKSTTLAGILKELNNEEVNIVTLEDPIEYFVEGVSQSQIHEEIGYTFSSGLRHILRQDPDIIMVGEIRDRETAALAIQAALTGHIVLSTLHTNDAMGVVPRLIDMGVEKYLIPPTLNVAAAQRLLRRLCADCKLKTKANVAEEGIIN